MISEGVSEARTRFGSDVQALGLTRTLCPAPPARTPLEICAHSRKINRNREVVLDQFHCFCSLYPPQFILNYCCSKNDCPDFGLWISESVQARTSLSECWKSLSNTRTRCPDLPRAGLGRPTSDKSWKTPEEFAITTLFDGFRTAEMLERCRSVGA